MRNRSVEIIFINLEVFATAENEIRFIKVKTTRYESSCNIPGNSVYVPLPIPAVNSKAETIRYAFTSSTQESADIVKVSYWLASD